MNERCRYEVQIYRSLIGTDEPTWHLLHDSFDETNAERQYHISRLKGTRPVRLVKLIEIEEIVQQSELVTP